MTKRKIDSTSTISNAIQFYDAKKEYGFLSNFYGKRESKLFSLEIGGLQWDSVEHYFQASKFMGLSNYANEASREYANLIRSASTPNIAKVLANQKIGGGYPYQVES
jgi:predicted NAD-dependent protein-ADP-ribosyltransferase YbiA (DUF1768 family)